MQVVYLMQEPIYRKYTPDPVNPREVSIQEIWGIPVDSPIATAVALRWPADIWYQTMNYSPAVLGTP